jgi:hypothetical protein
MEEGNGMKQDGIILYFDVPKLVVFNQSTPITTNKHNIPFKQHPPWSIYNGIFYKSSNKLLCHYIV